MTKFLARKDTIISDIAIIQAKLIDFIYSQKDIIECDFVHFDDGDFHEFSMRNDATGAVLIFHAPKHPMYFTEVEDAQS